MIAFAALPAVLALLAPAPAPREKEAVLWARLRARVADVERRLDGVLGLSLRDLKTGASMEIRPDEAFPLASSIKLAVLDELYRQADAGKIDLGQVTTPPVLTRCPGRSS